MRLLLFFLLFAHALSAQTDSLPPASTDTSKVYEAFDVDKPPVFPGGESEMLKFIAKNIQYPQLAREKDTQGSVICEAVVEKDGRLSNIRIYRDIGDGCGEELVRVIGLMPIWEPGTRNGKTVRVRQIVAARFKLEGGKKNKKSKN